MNNRPKLTDAEYRLMDIIWRLQQATINEVHQAISEDRGEELSRTTTQVQMNRLEEKGWLKRQKLERKFLYSATMNRQESRHEILQDIKARVFNGSTADLLKCFFDSKAITTSEIEQLRQLIETQDGGLK